MSQVVLMGVGDVILDPQTHKTAFDGVKHILADADFTVCNCDQIYSDKCEDPSGYWQIQVGAPPSDPSMLDSIRDANINAINLGNNHSLDWGYEAVFDCLERCKNKGITAFGVGRSIEEARRPAILEKNGTRIGLLAYCCIGPSGYEATDVRPGHVPMRAFTHYEQWDPQPGTPPLIRTFANKRDLRDMIDDIAQLRQEVDVLVVCYHWGVHYIPAIIADYQFEVGHAAVDAGADVIFGNHAHLPKGVEVYKGKVIYYGMHNFACHGEWQPPAKQPGCKFPESYLWDWSRFGSLMVDRFGRVPDHESRPTMIAKIVIQDDTIQQVSYVPCYIGDDLAPVAIKQSDERGQIVYEHFRKISDSQGLNTTFTWKGDEILIGAGDAE